jgi:PST family polysaccharide transporter
MEHVTEVAKLSLRLRWKNLLVNYGFDLSASREIAQVRDDNSKLNEVFWSVLWTKSFLFLVSTLMFAVALTTIPQLRANLQVFMASYLVLMGYVAFPTWLFQGMENLGMTAILNFIVKLAFTVGIFAFLKDRNQYIVVPLLSSGGQILAGGLAAVYATRKLVPDFKGPKISKIIGELKQGWTVFISTVFINFYTASNTVILGFFAAQEDVGYFTGGLKILSPFPVVIGLSNVWGIQGVLNLKEDRAFLRTMYNSRVGFEPCSQRYTRRTVKRGWYFVVVAVHGDMYHYSIFLGHAQM